MKITDLLLIVALGLLAVLASSVDDIGDALEEIQSQLQTIVKD